jgi:hypothetical protein
MTPAPLVGSPVKLRVVGRADGKPAGFDSAIVGVPRHWYLTVDGERVFLARLLNRLMGA